MQELLKILQEFGFPVFCVICLGWYAKDTTNKQIDLTREVTSALVSATKTLEDFKQIVGKLLDKED